MFDKNDNNNNNKPSDESTKEMKISSSVIDWYTIYKQRILLSQNLRSVVSPKLIIIFTKACFVDDWTHLHNSFNLFFTLNAKQNKDY